MKGEKRTEFRGCSNGVQKYKTINSSNDPIRNCKAREI